jgi:tetratricopeptide repeat protein 30
LLERRASTDLFTIPAVALANLCVAYVLADQNETAEELIRTIEREEEELVPPGNSDGQIYHSCIIGLCIGSLYCERKSYAFGIDRICNSMEPIQKNICSDTWFYAKKCFLAYALSLSNQSATIKDDMLRDLLLFFDETETYGKDIPTESDSAESTIALEAKQLKKIFVLLANGEE